MAILDAERNAVVIRIVYDGPPEAGKTTSLRALSASLARPMTTPAQAGERTLFFDWLEYTGGLFEGRQIRCQVVSVPGQAELAHRRRALLEAADVVVFVSDSTHLEEARVAIREMRGVLRDVSGPPVGFIVQANKRDRPGAADLGTLREALADDGAAVLESVATSGSGVREAFVFAVRLALDRVRELLRDRTLEIGAPQVQDSADLLRELTRLESDLGEEVAEEQPAPPAPPGSMLPPSPDVPSGMIWPPVEGRVLLADACATPFVPRQTAHGDWIGQSGRWRFHSPRQADYADPELGRRALIEWARVHASGQQRWLSTPRVVVLAPSGSGTWRLWQLVRVEESLRDQLLRAGTDASASGLLRRMLDTGRSLHVAMESLVLAPYRLPITVDTVGAPNGMPVYIGLLPDPFLARTSHPISAEHRPTLLRRELSALASAELRRHAGTTFPPLRAIARETDAPAVVEAVQDVLADAGLG